MVEFLPSKQNVAGSSPVTGSMGRKPPFSFVVSFLAARKDEKCHAGVVNLHGAIPDGVGKRHIR